MSPFLYYVIPQLSLFHALLTSFPSDAFVLYKTINAERTEKIHKEREMRLFITTLMEKEGIIDSFDEEIWIILVEKIEVFNDKKCIVYFKNGVTVDAQI